MSKYYGVSQYNHGHEYRWIFTEEEIINQIGTDTWEYITQGKDWLGNQNEPPYWVDILFPIGGSNSSATVIEDLKDDNAIKEFLTRTADGPDLEDPMLVDIAEYLLTVDTDCGSCTQIFLDKFGLIKDDLSQYDDYYHHYEESKKMLEELIASGKYNDIIDSNSPFYGFSSDLRYFDLCDMYDEYKKELEDEFIKD